MSLLITGKKLSGEISVSASKNSCLPILFATFSVKKKLLQSLCLLCDINTSIKLLKEMGAQLQRDFKFLKVNACHNINNTEAPYELSGR